MRSPPAARPRRSDECGGWYVRTLVVVALEVVVVQHGEKEQRAGDPGLTERGVRQAVATARWLAGRARPVGVWSSPMRRATETATPIASVLGIRSRVDPRLRERMNWNEAGVESIEDFLADWRAATADRAYVPRRGDSSFEAASRMLAVLDELALAHPIGTAVVVSHGGVTADVLRTLLGDDALLARTPGLVDDGVPNCAVTTLQATAYGWSVVSIAQADHLRGLDAGSVT